MHQLSYMAKVERDWIYLERTNRVTLTKRQQLVLQHIANGLRAEETAFKLGCSVAMIRKHEAALRKKLGAKTNAEAIANSLRAGF